MLILLLASLSAHASPCGDLYDMKGNAEQNVVHYDELVSKLPTGADGVKALEEFRGRYGLPVAFAAPDDKKVRGYADYFTGDGPSGSVAYVFTRKIALRPKGNLALDQVFEVASPRARRALRAWHVPFNGAGVAAVAGTELRVPVTLASFCPGESDAPSPTFTWSIAPNGDFHVEAELKGGGKTLSECPAAKALFPKSDYAACVEYSDLRTRKKRVLVFEAPMT